MKFYENGTNLGNRSGGREYSRDAKTKRLESELVAAKVEIERLSGKTGFCAECERQARLLGKSGSREAKLIAELSVAKRENEVLKAFEKIAYQWESENKRLREALAVIASGKFKHGEGNGFGRTCTAPEIAQSALDGGKA